MQNEIISKERIIDELEMRGWEVIKGTDRLTPPNDLWNNSPSSFHVYEAIDVEELLNKEFFNDLLMEEL